MFFGSKQLIPIFILILNKENNLIMPAFKKPES